MFQAGQTHGVFQFESSGMRDTLRKAKPQCLEDLIALNALYRPGPLRGGVVDDYIARKHGRVEIKYDLPQMESVLKETYGVIAYQEQVMRLASELAGFTLGQADELRRAMGKKDAAKMQAQRDQLHDRLPAQRDRREEGQQDLRVHRVLRRLRLQQVALDDLRAARVPDRVPQGELPAALHGRAADDRIAELRQGRAVPGGVPRPRRAGAAAGHQCAASCSSSSSPTACGSAWARSRAPAKAPSCRSWRRARTLGGRITSLFALAEHIDLRLVNKKVLECLVKAGAFDSLAPGGRESYLAWRPRLLAGLDRILDHGSRHQQDRDQGQSLLFGGDADEPAAARRRRRAARRRPWTETEALAFEKEALGLYMSGHPLQRYAEALAVARRPAPGGPDAVGGRLLDRPAS